MDTENIETNGPKARSCAADGYATDVEHALGVADRTQYRRGRRTAAVILAAEVRRLRVLLKRGRDMVNTPPDAPLEDWPSDNDIDAFVSACDAALGQSHNKVAERTAQR